MKRTVKKIENNKIKYKRKRSTKQKVEDVVIEPDRIITIGSYKYEIFESANLRVRLEYIGSDEHVTESPLTEIEGNKILSFSELFRNKDYIKSIDMTNWDLSQIDDMYRTFEDCTNLESVNFGNGFNNVLFMSSLFKNCKSLKEVKNLKSVAPVIFLDSAFSGCSSLKTIDLSDLNLEVYAVNMFANCNSLETVVFPQEGTLHKTDIMFTHCDKLKEVNFNNIKSDIELYNIFRFCPQLDDIIIGIPNMKTV